MSCARPGAILASLTTVPEARLTVDLTGSLLPLSMV